MNMQVKIDATNFKFPQPKYHFGQELSDSQGDKAIIVGIKCNTEQWEYEPWYPELGCLGNWISEEELDRIAIDINSSPVQLSLLPESSPSVVE